MQSSRDRFELGRVGTAAFVAVLVVLATLRVVSITPWTMPAFDLYAYWSTRFGLDYSTAHQGLTGAYLYSPAFAEAIRPLTLLPWPVFAGLWTLIAGLPLAWLAGRFALPLLLLPPFALSVAGGQLDLLFAAVILLGWRWPALWAFPILTKVTPGIGLVWFLVRREWRSLALALGATGGIALASAALDSEGWAGWLAMLGRRQFPALSDTLWLLPVPLGIRLVVATGLIGWGAATDRRWTVPVAVCLSVPTVFVNAPAILVALLPLAAVGARTPAGAWLRREGGSRPAALPRRQIPAWLRRLATLG
jgi:hypothetical protein